ncbi:xanthine phosphoribosyltransferase [Anaerobium acetethylicum]|uniref:Xanthine phosphoribosyltransferase n=1 Tax=Anaerobium acetethylicum TaxID=1619234 RepID=A0A1D3TR24_9FIRM|nr:xanthine phosphoribosyltransferase [Anaerobium acetethylicum]SCP96103.1 xanthine phosphoribosyltransferase [Anaerobium acetethylicum]
MKLLQDRILKDGVFKEGGILKVDSFLNHQMDIELLNEIGKEFARLFKDKKVSKILTIEASGIGIACIAAQYFGVPVVFAKKAQSKNLDGEIYTSTVHSYTHDKEYIIRVSKKFITKDDCVLVIDDFLANGKALIGLMEIIEQSGAELAGCGICIEKGFQDGGKYIRSLGVDLQSLAIIDYDENGNVLFR